MRLQFSGKPFVDSVTCALIVH